MAKLLMQRTAVRLLAPEGWTPSGRSRHGLKMCKAGEERPLILPGTPNTEYGKGLTRAILRQAGLPSKEAAWNSRSSYTRRAMDTGRRSANSPGASRQLER